MSRGIEISWKNMPELDPTRKAKLFKGNSTLKINLTGSNSFQLASMEVDRNMILDLCQQDRSRYQWRIETHLEDHRVWLEESGLEKFVLYLGSGFMRVDEQSIWLYILLACAFKSQSFIISAMKYKFKLQLRDRQILSSMLNHYFVLLRSIKNNQEDDFWTWLIINNPDSFSLRSIIEYKINVVVSILEAKAKAGKFDLNDVQELEDMASIRYPDPRESLRYVFKLIPWEQTTVQVVERFKDRLEGPDCLNKLERISQRIEENKKKISTKRAALETDLVGMKKMYELKQKQYYTKQLENLIAEENLVSPNRYQAGPPVREQPQPQPNRYSNQTQQPTGKKVSQADLDYQLALQLSKQNEPKPQPQNSYTRDQREQPRPPRYSNQTQQPTGKKVSQADLDYQLALQLSKYNEPKSQQPINKQQNPPIRAQNTDDEIRRVLELSKQDTGPKRVPTKPEARVAPNQHCSASCNSKQREKVDCGHTLCLACIKERYYNRTEAFEDMIANRPLSFQKSTKARVNCWICPQVFTKRDIEAINGRRK